MLTRREFADVAGEFTATGVVDLETVLEAMPGYVASIRAAGVDVAVTGSLVPFVPSLMAWGHDEQVMTGFLDELAGLLRPVHPVIVYLDGIPGPLWPGLCSASAFGRVCSWRRAVTSTTRPAAPAGRREGRALRSRSRPRSAMPGWARRERWRALTMPRMGRTAQVRVTVTRVAGDGSVRRAVVDAAGRDDAARWEQLIDQADLGVPPPYRARPGEAVYHIRAGELEVQVAERDLTGPLRELVTAVLAEGGDG